MKLDLYQEVADEAGLPRQVAKQALMASAYGAPRYQLIHHEAPRCGGYYVVCWVGLYGRTVRHFAKSENRARAYLGRLLEAQK